VNYRDYLKSLGADSGTRIAVVTGDGAIIRGGSGGGPFSDEGVMSSGSMVRVLREVREDASIRAVILRIDSPGGDAIASDDILREAKLLSQKKPLVVSMSDVAASGGYFVGMTGDSVLAYPNTITGSIGVIYGKVNLRGLYDKLGIRQEMLTRGRFAGIDSEYEPLSDAARKKLREGVDAVYKTFVQHVADARKRPYGEIDKLAQGRVWLGSQAKENALVDELGGLDRAIELIRAKAKIPAGEKIALAVYPQPRSILDQLLSRSHESTSTEAWMSATARRIGWNVAPLLEGGMLKLMPFDLHVR
jgi:protease-4